MPDSLSIFRSGLLLMPTEPPPAGAVPAEPVSYLIPALTLISIGLILVLLNVIMNAMPDIFRSFARARGSAGLEGSVRIARDRNITALLMVVPFVLVADRSGLYDPAFLRALSADGHLVATLCIFLLYLLLRMTLFVQVKPRRGYDNYALARRCAWNIFIILAMGVSVTYGILHLVGPAPGLIRSILLTETTLLYLFLLLRRGQVLSVSCNPFTTFLYLCTLEILPTGLLVASAFVL